MAVWEENEVFLLNNDAREVLWVYFNPDSTEGGQFVENRVSYNLILEAEPQSENYFQFFDYIESNCSQYLIDIDTQEFEVEKKFFDFNYYEPDFEGISKQTMRGLVAAAKGKGE